MMLYHKTKFGCKRTGSLGDIEETDQVKKFFYQVYKISSHHIILEVVVLY